MRTYAFRVAPIVQYLHPVAGRGYVLVPRATVGLDLLRSNTQRNKWTISTDQMVSESIEEGRKAKATESTEDVQQCEMTPYLTELMGHFKIAAAGDNFDGGLCSKTFSNCILVSELKAC